MNNTQFGSNGFVAVIVRPTRALRPSEIKLPAVWQTRIVPVTDREMMVLGGQFQFKTQLVEGEVRLVCQWGCDHEELPLDEETHAMCRGDRHSSDGYLFDLKFCSSLQEAQDWLAEQVSWWEMVRRNSATSRL